MLKTYVSVFACVLVSSYQNNHFLAFGENLILIAHPSKTGGDWWHGTLLRDGKSGFFPKTYVEKVETGTTFDANLCNS